MLQLSLSSPVDQKKLKVNNINCLVTFGGFFAPNLLSHASCKNV